MFDVRNDGEGVIVYVLDSGFDSQWRTKDNQFSKVHPGFSMYPQCGEPGIPGAFDWLCKLLGNWKKYPEYAQDTGNESLGHGTHVSGIIGCNKVLLRYFER